jgi:HlyD family secretion protein
LNLRTTGASAANDTEKARQDLNAYQAQVKADQAMLDKDLNGPTPTALAQARARVAEADAALALAREALGRRCLCSPINGKVLYVYKRPGEAIDLESPSPILSLAESGPMRLRADVDEADIGRIFVGQKVLATSESLNQTYAGTVISMEPMMGRRNILTNRPRERQDTRIREVVIQMQDDASQLPIDLMMTVRFLRTVAATTEPAATMPAAAGSK